MESKINRLETENRALQEQKHQQDIELKEKLSQLTDLTSKLSETKQKISELEKAKLQIPEANKEVIDTLKEKLKNAAKQIMDVKAENKKLIEKSNASPELPKTPVNNFEEAVTSLQTTVLERDQEIVKLKSQLDELQTITKREQRLIISAWYEMGTQLQRRPSLHAANSSHPSSYLAQQRRKMLELKQQS